jgi:hypothetical protein
VLNQGNVAAFGVSVAVDAGSKFLPANGQASATLSDVFPNGVTSGSLNVVVASDAPNGTNTIPITFTYRDADGKILTSKASLSVTVNTQVQAPQVTLLTYETTPTMLQQGASVLVTAQIQNTGTKTASQVLIRITGDSRVMLAGVRGDAFPIGNLEPNEIKTIEMPLIVAQDAKSGVQAQSFTISYIQDDKIIETTGTISVQIAQQTVVRPLILLQNSSVDVERLKPGDTFTLEFTLQNVGAADAQNMLVVFGTVNSDSPPPSGTPGSNGGGTSTTSSSQFAPINGGEAEFVGTLAQGQEVTLSQEFIVSATLDSGIYRLPINAQYVRSDSTTVTDSFGATVVVVAPPKLQLTFDSQLPPTIEVGTPITLGVTVTNRGKNPLVVNGGTVSGENIDVFDGAEITGGQYRTDENFLVNATVAPNAEGEYTVVLSFNYIDDLNQPQTIDYTFTAEATAPFVVPEEPFPPEGGGVEIPIETPAPPISTQEMISKLLLGFLGLGG